MAHERCKAQVAIGGQRIEESRKAAIVIEGVDLVCEHEHSADGPRFAAAFLKDNSDRFNIPHCFWLHFESWAKCAHTVTTASASNFALPALKTESIVKHEQCDKSELVQISAVEAERGRAASSVASVGRRVSGKRTLRNL